MEQFIYLFSGLRWQDALDIALNSYILFRLYVLFRGTNVIRVLLVICILWAISQTAGPLGLIITNWAMQGIITVAALIIIIVFRHEITSVLQTKDLKAFLWGIPKYPFNTPLNIIAQSVCELAENKVGAIIVLPQKKNMTSVVQEGTPIKGKLSREMLVSIFWPGNPIHDGAVIIHGDQITSAGSILPLSKRKDLPSSFGTRHRAALGVSEITDALVIVVSEERGRISIFREKQTFNIRNKNNLEKVLIKNTEDESTKKGLQQQTLEFFLAAFISLICVTGVWLSFSKGLETLATYEIPVELVNPAQKMEIVSASDSNVKLLISGARPLIKSIKPEQINVKLNLSQSVIGVNSIAVNKDNILLPPGIRLIKIDPPKLDVTLDTMIEKDLPIQPHWTGKLPKGLIMTAAHSEPKTIQVTGGGIILENVATIFTEKIQLDKLKKSGTVKASLIISQKSLKIKEENSIKIQYIIEKIPKPGNQNLK